MVRFNKDELYILLNALESYWGDYEDETNYDEEKVKINKEAKLLSNKISWELEQRDMRKMEKQLLKKAKELQEKQKNNN